MTAQTAPEMLVGASKDFLRRFSPFNKMEPEALTFLAEHAALVFYPGGSQILAAHTEVPRHFYIIQRGKVQARQANANTVTEYTSLSLGPGECFPIGSLSASRPPTNNYIAQEDCFCFQISAEDFMQLMQTSPVFHLFCTQYIASLLNQSRQQLQSTFSQRAAELQTMTTALEALIKRPPVHVPPDTPTRTALETMAEARVGCIVITNPAQQPIGILTSTDILPRVVLADLDLTVPVSTIMSTDPHRINATASAYDAALEMATHNIRHLLVVDTADKLQGVVSERDLFSLQRISLRQIRASIESAHDIDALQHASRDIHTLALNLIAQGVGAEQLTRFISALNDALTRRIIILTSSRHDLEGIDYAWVAFGSEGRHEQTLSTDQDNGIIWHPSPEPGLPTGIIEQRLLAFAREVNDSLAACGFPLCKGNIMASNPELCLTLGEWKNRFSDWIREPYPEALLNASIFFDFRVLYGNTRLGDQLRRWLSNLATANPVFQRMMAANALAVSPPLGRIRDFITDDNGEIDLKISGARLFVDIARIMALRLEIETSGTVPRLQLAAQKTGIPPAETAAIIDAFHFIQLLRLRTHHLETETAHTSNNKINPDTLNELDRRILKEAFRQARKLQLRLKLDYQL